MSFENVMNVIRVNQMGSISIDDSGEGLSWNDPFSIVMQVKYLLQPEYSILFQKNGFLKLEIMDGYLAISGVGIPDTAVSFSLDESDLDQFHLFAVTYCRSVLRVFHNYSLILVLSVEHDDSASVLEPIIVGESFEGYINYLRVYKYALSAHEINGQSNIFSVRDQDGVLLELSAITGKINCSSREISYAECDACNLIPCFSFKRYGNIKLIGDTDVNPGGSVERDSSGVLVAIKPYTVVTEIYFIPSNQEKYYIFSNGTTSVDSGMSLYIEKSEDGAHYLCAKLGNSTQIERIVRSPSPIKERQWIRIANTYIDGALKLVVDQYETICENINIGDTYTAQVGQCTIGDCVGYDEILDVKNFSGYLKYVFVLDEVLPEEKCLMDNPLEIYSLPSLVGAYEAQSVQEKNQVGTADIYMSRGVKSLLLEDSYDPLDLQKIKAVHHKGIYLERDSFGFDVWIERNKGEIILKYRGSDGEEIAIDSVEDIGLSDETLWLIEGLLIAIVGVMSIVSGLKVSSSGSTKVLTHLINLIENPYMRTAIQLLCRNVSWTNIVNLFRVIYQTGFLKRIVFSLFDLSWLSALSAALDVVGVITGVKILGIAAGVSYLIYKIVSWACNRPGNKESRISLSKVIFLHPNSDGSVDPSQSAVYMQSDYNVVEADYDHAMGAKNNVLYISSMVQGNLKIKAEFVVEGDSYYDVSVKENNDTYVLQSQEVRITQDVSSTLFSFPHFTLSRVLDRADIEFVWKGKKDGGVEFEIARSQHRLYFLPSEPRNPIIVRNHDEKATPLTGVLDIYFDYCDREHPMDIDDDITRIVKALYTAPIFMYDGMNSITTQPEKTSMCLKTWCLAEGLKNSEVKVNCRDISTLAFYFLFLISNPTNFALMLITPINELTIKCKSVRLVGESEIKDREFDLHWVLVNQGENNGNHRENYTVYDPCLMYHVMVQIKATGKTFWTSSSDVQYAAGAFLCEDAVPKEQRFLQGSYFRNLTQENPSLDWFDFQDIGILGFYE